MFVQSVTSVPTGAHTFYTMSALGTAFQGLRSRSWDYQHAIISLPTNATTISYNKLFTAHGKQRAQTWDDNVSQTCIGNPELRYAVPFSTRYEFYMSKKHLTYAIWTGGLLYLRRSIVLHKSHKKNRWYKTKPQKQKPRNMSYPLPPKINFQRTPRATNCTDRAHRSTTVSGWPSSVDLLNVCANGARTKRYDRKQTEISQVYVQQTCSLQGSPPGRAWGSGAKLTEKSAQHLTEEARNIYGELYTYSHLKYNHNCPGPKYLI